MADSKHCWDPILDAHGGGIVPILLILDAKAQPVRAIMVTRPEQARLHFKCCRCNERATRTFDIALDRNHGPHHSVFALPEAQPLPDGPCSGAAPS